MTAVNLIFNVHSFFYYGFQLLEMNIDYYLLLPIEIFVGAILFF